MAPLKNKIIIVLILIAGSVHSQQLPKYVRDNYFISRLLYYHDPAKYGSPYSQYYFQIKKENNKYGIYNDTDKSWGIKPVYDSITRTANVLQNGKWFNLLFTHPLDDHQYSDPLYLIIQKNNRKGLMSAKGDTMLQPQYDEVRHTELEGFFLTRNGNAWGYVSLTNKNLRAEPQFDCVYYDKQYLIRNSAAWIQRSCIITYKNGIKNVYSKSGIPLNLSNKGFKAARKGKSYPESENLTLGNPDGVYVPEDRIVFQVKEKYGLEDLNFKEVVPAKYDCMTAQEGGNFQVILKGLYGIIDKNGVVVIPPIYKNLIPIPYPLAVAYLAEKEDGKFLLDTKGNTIYNEVIEDINWDDYRFTKNKQGEDILWLKAQIRKTDPVVTYSVNGNEMAQYAFVLLKYENGAVKTAIETSYNFDLYSNALKSLVGYGRTSGYGLFNIDNEKFDNSFTRIYKGPGNTLLASRIKASGKPTTYELLIDNALTIKTLPYPVVQTNDRFMIAVDKGNMHVLNNNGYDIGFSYSLIDSFKNEATAPNLLKYYEDPQNPKFGILDAATGKVITKAGIYDQTSLAWKFVNNGGGPERKPYPDVVVAHKTGGKPVTDVYKYGKKIATIPYRKDERTGNLDFTTNNQMVIYTKDSVSVYNLTTHTYDLALPVTAKTFSVQPDGSFYFNYKNKDKKNVISTYNPSGTYMGDLYYDASYKPVAVITKENGKYGIKNDEGIAMIPFINDTLYTHNNRNFIAKRGTKYGVVANNNTTILPFDYDAFAFKSLSTGESYWEKFNYFLAEKDGRYSLYNQDFKLLGTAGNDAIEVLREKYIITRNGALYSVYDLEGKLLCSITADKIQLQYGDYFQYYKNGLCGIADTDGRVLLPPIYKYASISNGVIIAGEGDKAYIVSNSGDKLIPTGFVDIYVIAPQSKMYDTSEIFIKVSPCKNTAALYSSNYKELIPPVYTNIEYVYDNKYVHVKLNDKHGIVSTENKIIIPAEYDSLEYLENYNYFKVVKGKEYKLLSLNGTLLETGKND